ncbi:MAG: hypothetical protein H8K03_21500 [Nitrospira sp.]
MRQHKDAWLRAYDQALEPITKSECPEPAAVSISDLRLNKAVEACLRHAGIRTLTDILNMTEDEFLNKRYLGKSTLRAIQDLLTRLGLSFKPSAVSDTLTTVERLAP